MDAIISAIILVIAVIYTFRPRGERTYTCPKCGMSFTRKPGISIHTLTSALITCPYCGIASFMRPSK